MDSALSTSSPAAIERADQSVSTRFTRLMNATTSRWGVVTDPPLIALITGVFLLASLGALGLGLSPLVVRLLFALTALPVTLALLVSLALLGARRRVVAWLASQPFPVENMNAILNGLGEGLEITFAGADPEGASYRDGAPLPTTTLPTTAELNAELDKVHPDAFVTDTSEEARTLEIRIGVVDSKRNPASTNHQRYARVQALVERVLVPLAARLPIETVRVK
jgi:hypothetical protein